MEEVMDTKEVEDIKPEKKGFWHLVAEPDLFEMVEKSGYGEYEFQVFQKKRFRNSLIASLAAVVPAIFISPWLAFLGTIFFLMQWRSAYTKEKKEFQDLLYDKQISWFSFQRLVVSYLTGDGKSDSIFVVFKKILSRLEEGEFKSNLQRLIIEITEDPESVRPFLTFANNAAGGTDSALTFMTALYNFKNHTHDNSVIDELSEKARNEMIRGIHEIRQKKEKDFYYFPTKLTMLNIIPMFGFMIGVVVYVFTNNMSLL